MSHCANKGKPTLEMFLDEFDEVDRYDHCLLFKKVCLNYICAW